MMPRRRLLFVAADEFPTHRPDVAVLFGKELPSRGIDSDVVAQRSLGQAGQDDSWPPGQAFLCDRTGNRLRDQATAFWHDLRMLWKADACHYDAIQVRDKVFAGILALIRARQCRRPFFFWMSFPMSEGFIDLAHRRGLSLGLVRWAFLSIKGHLGKLLIYKVVLRRCDHAFVQSEYMKNDLASRGIPLDRMTAVPMGVDLDRVVGAQSDGAKAGVASTAGPVIAYLGALDRARRIDFLFEVFAAVRKHVPGARLLLVGDTLEQADREWLKSKATELGVADGIVWTGWVPTAAAWDHLRGAEVAVSVVPRGELFDCASPTKIVEYLAFGLPVVANDQPDQHQVLSESGAGFSVAMDVGDFAQAVLKILTDSELAGRMREAGPPYVRAHRSYAMLGRQVADVYASLWSDS